MHPLLRGDAGQVEDVIIPPDAVFVGDQPGLAGRNGRQPVGDQLRLPPVHAAKVVLHALAQDDDLVRKAGCDLLAPEDVRPGEAAPLAALVIQTVDGDHAPLAHELWQPQRHAGALSVEVHHVIPSEGGPDGGKDRGAHGRQALQVHRRDRQQPHAFVLLLRSGIEGFAADMMAAPVVAGDGMPQRRHPDGQMFHHNLHAALTGGDPLVAKHCNSHVFLLCRRVYSPSMCSTALMVPNMIFQSTRRLRSSMYFRSSSSHFSKLRLLRLGWICQ